MSASLTQNVVESSEPDRPTEVSVPVVPQISVETRNRFASLTAAWKSDPKVMVSANPKAVLKNEGFQALIAMGSEILPLIFDDYKRENSYWPLALIRIVGASPVKIESRGDFEKIRQDWLAWGREHGYLRD